MNLEEYRKYKGMTYDQLADQVRVERTKVYRVCKKSRICKLNEAISIVDRTDGYVRIEDLPQTGGC